MTIPANTIITASTCSPNTKFDTFVSIFSGDCLNPICKAYNDDDPNCTQVHQSTVSKTMAASGTYFISVSSKDGSSGNINLKLSYFIDELLIYLFLFRLLSIGSFITSWCTY